MKWCQNGHLKKNNPQVKKKGSVSFALYENIVNLRVMVVQHPVGVGVRKVSLLHHREAFLGGYKWAASDDRTLTMWQLQSWRFIWARRRFTLASVVRRTPDLLVLPGQFSPPSPPAVCSHLLSSTKLGLVWSGASSPLASPPLASIAKRLKGLCWWQWQQHLVNTAGHCSSHLCSSATQNDSTALRHCITWCCLLQWPPVVAFVT